MKLIVALCFAFLLASSIMAGGHPSLVLNLADVKAVKANWNKYPVLKSSYLEVKNNIDGFLTREIDVPQPKDAAGYTHETHKRNYLLMYQAGLMFAFTGEEKYSDFVRSVLLKYADLYPKLGIHPAAASSSPGRLFWQSLNEANWLFYSSQAYDCVYEKIPAAERQQIENNVFRPIAHYFIEDREEEFNLIHNHGTWSCAAVGLAGMAMKDNDLVEKALYGTKKNKTGGFIRQIEELFSPDGYYVEGAYYTRYALLPFFAFARAIDNNKPELKIFEFRNQLFKKALYTAIQQTSFTGDFIPINDAIKAKNYQSPEIVMSLNTVFERYGRDRGLLAVAKAQGKVTLSSAGVEVAKALDAAAKIEPFPYTSVEYTDGAKGNEGGIAILRSGTEEPQSMAVMKYTGHGLSHGHYDKFALLYYDQGREILQDYGSARFINVDPKYGGRYLPENKSWAMQSIAHNTITVDEQTHYQGKITISEQFHPDRHFFSVKDPSIKIVSAKDTTAYAGVRLQRTIAMISDPRFEQPLLIDVFKVRSDKERKYDLPYYYMGQMINTNVKYTFEKELKQLGKGNGYQHLWKQAEGKPEGKVFQFSWLAGERFYTLTSAADPQTQILYTRLGASDPNFNLRNDPGVMLSRRAAKTTFATVLEPHGMFDEVREFTSGVYGAVSGVEVLETPDEYTAIRITGQDAMNWILVINNKEASDTAKHSLQIAGKEYQWTGNFFFTK